MSDIKTHLMQDMMDNTPVSEEVEKEWSEILEGIKDLEKENKRLKFDISSFTSEVVMNGGGWK